MTNNNNYNITYIVEYKLLSQYTLCTRYVCRI